MTTIRALVRVQVSDIIGADRVPVRRVRATLSRILTAAETGLQAAEQHFEAINAERIKTHEGLAPLFRRTDQVLHARADPFRRCVVCSERQVVEAGVDHCADPLCRKTLVDSATVWKDVDDRWAIAANEIQQARSKIARAEQAQEYGAMEPRALAERLVQEDTRATDPSLTPEERLAAEAAYATALEVWFRVLEAYGALPHSALRRLRAPPDPRRGCADLRPQMRQGVRPGGARRGWQRVHVVRAVVHVQRAALTRSAGPRPEDQPGVLL